MKKLRIILISIILLFSATVGVYCSNYYHALDQEYENRNENVTIQKDNKVIAYEVDGSDTAFVFYPGGKVEFSAYEPLAQQLSERGITVIICHMPLNLAVFGMNKASEIENDYPQIKHWYIGGHSLGGVMAASYLKKNSEKYEGLVLLASYSTADLTKTDLKVLSIYGSNDGVLNLEKYKDSIDNLPNLTEIIIEGANHSGFGNYGAQKGDGERDISLSSQQQQTVDAICAFVGY